VKPGYAGIARTTGILEIPRNANRQTPAIQDELNKMKHLTSSNFLLAKLWTGWRRWIAWATCIGAIFLLGVFRAATDAELTFASFALIPVLVIAWIGGKRNGMLMAFLAATMWAISDLAIEQQYSAQWVPWANAITRLIIYCLVAFLTAQVRQQFEREYEHATHDPLTGLLNRRAFLDIGNHEVVRSKRYAHSLAVIFLDLDDFKQINDTKGHDVGDEALRTTAKALLSSLRSTDQVARLGGDEFTVLLPETGYDAASEAGRKISIAVKAALSDFPPVRASFGIAWFGNADRLFPEMLKAADQLMYEAKESGNGAMLLRRFS